MAKANQSIEWTVNVETQTLTASVKGVPGYIVLRMKDVSPENAAFAMLHGFKQRVADAAAIGRDATTGESASPQSKFDAMKRLADHYASGSPSWNVARAAGSGDGGDGIIVRAIARVQGTDTETIRERVARTAEKTGKTTRAILSQLSKAAAVAEAILRIRQEEAGDGSDADAMLDEMFADGNDEDDTDSTE